MVPLADSRRFAILRKHFKTCLSETQCFGSAKEKWARKLQMFHVKHFVLLELDMEICKKLTWECMVIHDIIGMINLNWRK